MGFGDPFKHVNVRNVQTCGAWHHQEKCALHCSTWSWGQSLRQWAKCWSPTMWQPLWQVKGWCLLQLIGLGRMTLLPLKFMWNTMEQSRKTRVISGHKGVKSNMRLYYPGFLRHSLRPQRTWGLHICHYLGAYVHAVVIGLNPKRQCAKHTKDVTKQDGWWWCRCHFAYKDPRWCFRKTTQPWHGSYYTLVN